MNRVCGTLIYSTVKRPCVWFAAGWKPLRDGAAVAEGRSPKASISWRRDGTGSTAQQAVAPQAAPFSAARHGSSAGGCVHSTHAWCWDCWCAGGWRSGWCLRTAAGVEAVAGVGFSAGGLCWCAGAGARFWCRCTGLFLFWGAGSGGPESPGGVGAKPYGAGVSFSAKASTSYVRRLASECLHISQARMQWRHWVPKRFFSSPGVFQRACMFVQSFLASMCMCVCMCVCVNMNVLAALLVSVCMCMCVCMCVCVKMHVLTVISCGFVRVHVRVHVHGCVCMCVQSFLA